MKCVLLCIGNPLSCVSENTAIREEMELRGWHYVEDVRSFEAQVKNPRITDAQITDFADQDFRFALALSGVGQDELDSMNVVCLISDVGPDDLLPDRAKSGSNSQ